MNSYIKIAICDDESIILNNVISKVNEIVKTSNYECLVEGFEDGNKLLHKIEEYSDYYDIYILDVDMEEINGLELAKKIKEIQEDGMIIFLTSYDTWMSEAFDVHAFNYILKERQNEKLEIALKECIKYIHNRKVLYFFSQGKNLINIPYKDIIYFESEKRKVKIVTINSEYYYYDTLNEIEKMIRKDLFSRVHMSFLVNMEYIRNFNGKGITLDNNLVIPVSRKYAYNFNMSFMEFLKERC